MPGSRLSRTKYGRSKRSVASRWTAQASNEARRKSRRVRAGREIHDPLVLRALRARNLERRRCPVLEVRGVAWIAERLENRELDAVGAVRHDARPASHLLECRSVPQDQEAAGRRAVAG